MNGALSETPWTRRQWLGWITAAFAAHLGLIFLLGERPAPPPTPGPGFQVALAESLAEGLMRRPDFADPALLALPSQRGFSGLGWMQVPAIEHEYHEWSEEQRWLELATNELGQSFATYVRVITGKPLAMTEKPPPDLAAPDLPMQPDWLPQKSTLRTEGPLAARKILRLPDLPAWPANDVLARTEVQVWVDEQGRVVSAVLLAECGQPDADRLALAMARGLAFEKAPRPSLVVGNLIFNWATVPATNAPANHTAP